ncbi:MAG: DUF1947 domain-containing protein [Candidatus Thorarchaeota archaeon]
MDISKRHAMRKNDLKDMKENLRQHVGDNVDNLFKSGAELIQTETNVLYAEKKEIIAFQFEDKILPSLRALNNNLVSLPSVTVDMGAIRFVTNGADIMAPGITKVTEGIQKGDFVMIIDEKFGKALAIGQLLCDGNEIKSMNKGKVIRNIHYVNDELWNLKL